MTDAVAVGLVGAGPWAEIMHAPVLAAGPETRLAGVWARRYEQSSALAARHGVPAFAEYEELLAACEAVAFSVPPDVQSELALRAARGGRHLLLEKPVALTERAATELADAAGEAATGALVFFTSRYDPDRRRWLAERAAQSGWQGASGLWLGSAFAADSPFDTPWRHAKGGLWDVGPHALSLLAGALGEITEITARPGPRDLVQLLVGHASGARASYAVSIDSPVTHNSLLVWGDAGEDALPDGPADAAECLAVAAGELVELAADPGAAHPCDLAFGTQVVALLAAAERQLGRS